MKKENIARVNELVKYIDELDLMLKSFEPGTAAGSYVPESQTVQKSEESLLYVYLGIAGKGNTAGNEAQQKFNGSIGLSLSVIRDCKEYADMKTELNDYIQNLYIQKCKALKKEFEKELEFL